MASKKLRNLVVILGVSLGVGLVVSLTVYGSAHYRQRLYAQLDAWQLTRHDEPFTELYFNNATTLPATYTPGSPQPISFTVHNLEGRTTQYSYRISAQAESSPGTAPLNIAHASLQLTHDQARSVTASVTLPSLEGRVRVLIELTSGDRTQSIQYWVSRE